MARARTRKQGLALAFGKYRHGVARRCEVVTETEYQRRMRDAARRGNAICWKCDRERKDSGENCEHCGAESTPF